MIQLKLKDETSATVYEMKAGIPVKVEKYSDFWRELPVTNTDQELPGM